MKNFDAALHFTILYGALVAFSFFSGAFGFMQPKKKKRYLVLVFFVLGTIMAFRSPNVGNDTLSYIGQFNTIISHNNPFDAIKASSAESGYVLYNWILGQIYPNARILFLISAIIICSSFGCFLHKHCENPGIFCCLLVGLLLFDFLLSVARQALAVAVLLFAIDAMIEKKTIKYYILTTLAVLFHNSSLIFFAIYPVYFFIEKQGKYKSVSVAIVFFFACVFAFFYEFFISLLVRILPKYEYYLGGATLDGDPRLAIAMKIAVYAILYFAPQILRRTEKARSNVESVSSFFAVANILLLFAAVRTSVLTRIATSFIPFCILQFANCVQKFSANNRKILTIMTCIAFYAYGLTVVILRTPQWQTTYPIDLSWLLS